MKRVVLVLALLGIFGLASGTASAREYGGWHSGWSYYGHHYPYHHGYYAQPRVVYRPPVVVPSYPVYGSYYRPWGYAPYNYGTLQIYTRGLSLWLGF